MNHQQLHHNTEYRNFVEIPVRSLIFLLKKLKISSLFKKYVKDGRAKKGVYSIESLLTVALEILLFRSPSKNNFYQKKQLGRPYFYKNLGILAGIEEGNKFPHSKTIDDAFWLLSSKDLEPILFNIFKKLCSFKLFSNHPSLKKTALII